jgi:hypothetical protein
VVSELSPPRSPPRQTADLARRRSVPTIRQARGAQVRHSAWVTLTADEFVAQLVETCPGFRPCLDEHLQDNEEVLLHLLVADVLRFAISKFEESSEDDLARCLAAVATGLTDGDEQVENAVAVSFVEDTGWWDDTMAPFIATWPEPLKAEAQRQRAWRPGKP